MSSEGKLLWEPDEARRRDAKLTAFLGWLERERGLRFEDYGALWRWSVTDLDAFWRAVWDYFDVRGHAPAVAALADATMPGARWFPGATLNYAEHALRRRDDHLAVVACDEAGAEQRLTYGALYALVARVQAGLRREGVGRGDRVAAWVTNGVEALATFLATAGLGAIWSSCSPDFGVGSVLDRFGQTEPRVLLAVDGYRYNGKTFDRRGELDAIVAGLPSVRRTVVVPLLGEPVTGEGRVAWDAFLGDAGEVHFEPVPFGHPLYVLYSSGTTGLPKPIVHGHGGILIEHLKTLAFHCDLGPDDRFFWFTTTGWMMWNFIVSGLLVGCTVVLYDGSPGHPDLGALWRMAERLGVTFFGCSAPYLLALQKEGYRPRDHHDVRAIRAIGSTGAPLPAPGFEWVYEAVHGDLLLGSISGGTDVCTAFVGSCPLRPVYAGEIQSAGLGCAVDSWAPDGTPVRDDVGELVITKPMPSMPVGFWNDDDGARYRDSYFSTFPGVWRHGDWVKRTSRDTFVIYGRSDSTLNRGGVRMGTSEFYRVVEALPEVRDSLVVDTGKLGSDDAGTLWLFVVLAGGATLDDALVKRIRKTVREQLSPRHVPDELRVVDTIPRTLNGKKMEVPVKRLLTGAPLERAVNLDTVQDRAALDPFLALASADGAEGSPS